MIVTKATMPLTLAELFYRSGLSQHEVCRRAVNSGLHLRQQAMHRLVTLPMKEYPKPNTIKALAAGLDVSYNEVLHAITASLSRAEEWSVASDDDNA